MENRIPIDDLFRDGLSQGKEQLNLGAWANMERMLDGKNPYSEEEPKRKRRFLPLFGILALLTTLLSAGYLMQKSKSAKKASNIEVVHENVTPNIISENSNDNSNTAPIALTDNNNSNQDIQINNNSSSTTSTSVSSNNTSNTKSIKQDNSISKNDINDSENDSKIGDSKAISIDKVAKKSEAANSKTDNNSLTETQVNPQPQEKKLSRREKKIAQTKIEKGNIENNSIQNQTSIAKNKIELQTVKQLELQQNISLNRNGEVSSITFDTIAQTTREIEKLTDVTAFKNTPNPRFVELSPEQELAANKKIELEKAIVPRNDIEPTLLASNKENSNLSIANSKQKDSKNDGYFKNVQDLAKSSYEKMSLASMKLFHMNLPIYTGFTAGVNASLFGTKHNFGGFQGGFTNMIPLSEYYSIMSELKIFYRNNSGYTVNDITTNILNPTIDPVTNASQNQTIYSYQLDSTNRIYNFKHIVSLELPVMMQRHFNNFAVYGGLNFAYNFKLNTNQIVRNYVINKSDTIDNSIGYNFQTEKGQNYVKQDFSSRFGIGYAVGASYSFNPNLYLDFRLSQNVWDNTKTNSAREISKGFFKVPSIQFSLGYRFKKFERD